MGEIVVALGKKIVLRFVEHQIFPWDKVFIEVRLVVGQQEEADGNVSVRSRFAGDEGVKSLGEFVDQICKEIRTKEIRKEEAAAEEQK